MNKIILTFFLFISFFAANSQKATISLTVEGMAGKNVLFEHFTTKPKQIFSGVADESGTVIINAQLPEYGFYKFTLDSGKDGFFLVTGPGANITMHTNLSNINGKMKLEGSRENAECFALRAKTDSVAQLMRRIEEEHKSLSLQSGQDARLQALVLEHQTLNGIRSKLVRNFMEQNIESLTVLFFTEDVKIDDAPELHEKLSEALVKKYPTNHFAKDHYNKVQSGRATRIGATAPDIALPTPDGDTVLLSSLRGKVVLIDFWAGWCGPCRRENPNLVQVYNKFKNQGFDIYGVSLDRDRDTWIKAIKDDNLGWVTVSDLKFWQSAPAKVYGVTSIPHQVLIDREGKIIAKNIRAHDLERMLPEIFANEKKN